MISNWMKMFGYTAKEAEPEPQNPQIALLNAKIAGLQDRCRTYQERALNAEAAHAHVKRNNRILGEALHEKVKECDELRPDAEKHRRSVRNLRQFQQPAPVASAA